MKKYLALLLLLVPALSFAEGFTGPYIGVFTGYSWADDDGKGSNGNENWTQNPNPRGLQLGLQGGYNWSLQNNILVGIEADYAHRGGDSDKAYYKDDGEADTDYALTSDLKASASIRARLGYLLDSTTLLYVTGGYATIDVERRNLDSYGYETSESTSDWQEGWTAGVGAEYLMTSNLSGRLEYRYSDYGTENIHVDMWSEDYKQSLTEQSVRVGLSYQF
jgi:outer membrane immunogenic protein